MEQEFSYSLQPRGRCTYKCMDLSICHHTNTTLWLFSCSCANGRAGYEKWFFTYYPRRVGRSSSRNAKVHITLVLPLGKENSIFQATRYVYHSSWAKSYGCCKYTFPGDTDRSWTNIFSKTMLAQRKKEIYDICVEFGRNPTTHWRLY